MLLQATHPKAKWAILRLHSKAAFDKHLRLARRTTTRSLRWRARHSLYWQHINYCGQQGTDSTNTITCSVWILRGQQSFNMELYGKKGRSEGGGGGLMFSFWAQSSIHRAGLAEIHVSLGVSTAVTLHFPSPLDCCVPSRHSHPAHVVSTLDFRLSCLNFSIANKQELAAQYATV